MASLMGFTTTATAAGTTTLTNTSSFYQIFTGSTTQTVVLPVVSTLALGWTFHICNNSTGSLTVNSSGGNAIITILPGTTAMCTCILITGTTAASWEAGLTDFSTATGTGSVVLAAGPSISSLTVTTDATVNGLTVGRGGSNDANNTALGGGAATGGMGTNSTAIGYHALYYDVTGTNNTAVGAGAIQGNNGLSYSYNTAVGSNALLAARSSYNTVIGYNAGSSIDTGGKNVVIGSYSGGSDPINGTGSNWIVLSDGDANIRQVIDPSGNAMFGTGAVVVYAPAPASLSTTATLTNANLQAQLINTTGTSFTVTMPTGSTLDTLVTWYKVDTGFDFSIINTASGTITIAGNTGVTTLGTMTIATGVSARFRIRRTAASTYVIYRIS
jgi:hypothetical protein